MRAAITTCLLILAAASSPHAHHGYAGFFNPTERTITVEGDVESLVYGNPHVVIRLRSADATTYTVTWQSAGWVERHAGMTKSTLKVGDHLVVVGAPSRDPASHDIAMVREVRRPADRWAWRSTAAFAKPS